MYFLILLVSLIAFIRAGPTCETSHGFVKCPTNFKCVDHVGCVPNDAGCRCATEPCPWPQQCDCKGGCKARTCNPIIGCSNKTNPTNACETMKCVSGKCVLTHRECANCNPVDGCPGTKAEQKVGTNFWDDHSQKQLSRQHVADTPTTSEAGWSGLVIGMTVVVIFVSLFVLAVLIYVGSTAK